MPLPSHTELFALKLVVSRAHPECSGYGWTDIYLTLRGRIKRTGTHCKHATATGAMYFPLMFDTSVLPDSNAMDSLPTKVKI